MEITKNEFMDFEKAQGAKLPYNILDDSNMSRARWMLTSLDINKYIYIVDHYNELKRRYGDR